MNIEIPYAEGPEKSVLSSLLKHSPLRAKAQAEGLTDEHFHLPGHALLFREIMRRAATANDEIDLVELIATLNREGSLDQIGGPAAIAGVYTYAPNVAHFDAHAQLLRESLARRRAIKAAHDVLESAADADPNDLTEALRKATESTASALKSDSGVMTAKQAAAVLMVQMQDAAAGKEFPGIPTGLDPIDIVTGGMRPGELWIVAAESSGGKSVVMLQAAATTLRRQGRVLVISLEMDAGIVMARLIACTTGTNLRTFTHPREAVKIDLTMAKRGIEELSQAPLSIHDRGGLSIDEIMAVARAEANRHGGIDLLVVDYLQLVEGRGRKGSETREQEVAAISRSLKALAKELRIPVFSASQLNDQGRLRESRAIGHDADVVLVIQEDGILGLKVRNGQRGQNFPLRLNGAIQRFQRFETTQQ